MQTAGAAASKALHPAAPSESAQEGEPCAKGLGPIQATGRQVKHRVIRAPRMPLCFPWDSTARIDLKITGQNTDFGTLALHDIRCNLNIDLHSKYIYIPSKGFMSHLSPSSQLHLQKCYCYQPNS